MLIGQLAARTGVSARALRHYEYRELLSAERDTNGYRVYTESDVVRVLQIRAMIDAGLATCMIRRYIDCARTGEHGTALEMCPELRAEVEVSNFQAQALQARNDKDLADTTLYRLIGASPESAVDLVDEIPLVEEEIAFADALRAALENRADLIEAEYAVRMQRESVAVA